MTSTDPENEYAARVALELQHYADCVAVHDLPPIYEYWSERYVRPLLTEVGFGGLHELFDGYVAEQCLRRAPDPARLVSLGAGNGDTEIALAVRLARQGIENLEVVLLELNGVMLERAMLEAERHAIAHRILPVEVDLNAWQPDESKPTDIYFANHSLHHIVELEGLLSGVQATLRLDGVLLVNDMIGRNGHVRWPEAADLVRQIWSVAPPRYRWNPHHRAVDESYPDIDCAGDGFEGIRAQDILPLLLEYFHPETYVTFANVVDPFVDRMYGPNFDISQPADLAFIDAVGRLDDAAIDLGLVTPTHLVAAFKNRPVPVRFPRQRSPERTVRRPSKAPSPPSPGDGLRDSGALAQFEAEARAARDRYDHLRGRKAVRIALRIAADRHRLGELARRLRDR